MDHLGLATEVVFALQRGDESALEQFIAVYDRPITGIVRQFRLRDEEDVKWQIFYHIFIKVKSFRWESAFSSWVYRVAKNCSLMEYRKELAVRNKPMSIVDDSFNLNSIESPAAMAPDANLEAKALLSIVRRLPQEQLKCLSLTLKPDSNEQAAKSNNIKIGAFKSRVFHARRSIRRALLLKGYDETENYRAVSNS